MAIYYYNDNTDEHNRHEVHVEGCSYLPSPINRTVIGSFTNCFDAIAYAKKQNPNKTFDGCYYCCKSCHKG